MLVIFESILPVFLLVLLGIGLKRTSLINGSFWDGMEQCSYYVLFPALLFQTMARADFSDTIAVTVSMIAIISFLAMSLLVLACWPMLKRIGMPPPTYTSLYQTATRWNGFMALAIASRTGGDHGLMVVGMVMAAVVVPVNAGSIAVLAWFTAGNRSYRALAIRIVSNPMIISTLAGIAINLAHVPIYQPIFDTIGMLAAASLSLGLITVGAGLRIADALKPSSGVIAAVVLKLAVFPLLAIGVGMGLGLTGTNLALLALSAAVPTAMNGYVLAKQMGGDAEFYAAAATVQTALAFFTIPVAMSFARYVTGG
ncbi:AEC family transporter [Neorhizobium lilium]|uniref:AEC family transporter n=1 Tax=Neorhizobium lilium TaxID=2503024 RepID=A0A444LIN9_9HYPH|nr:AEC family transporter [Neorhizobium lilium]RWX78805.1 AEC family transporter [Neorhizobium lilium]